MGNEKKAIVKSRIEGLPLTFHKMEGEPSSAYEYFCTFRNLGPSRSIAETARLLKRSNKVMQDKAREFKWIDRAELWDEEQDLHLQKQLKKMQTEARLRQAANGKKLQEVALTRLESMTEAQKKKLHPSQVARYLKDGSEIESKALGIASQVEVGGPGGIIIPSSVTVEIVHSHRSKPIDQ